MSELLRAPEFWAFCSGVLAFVRYLMHVFFRHHTLALERTLQVKQKEVSLEFDLERFKVTSAGKMIVSMKEQIDRIEPLVQRHERIIKQSEDKMEMVRQADHDMIQAVSAMKLHYETVHAALQVLKMPQEHAERITHLETEVQQLKSGNLFVKTKK